jgi:hypothetical protein
LEYFHIRRDSWVQLHGDKPTGPVGGPFGKELRMARDARYVRRRLVADFDAAEVFVPPARSRVDLAKSGHCLGSNGDPA